MSNVIRLIPTAGVGIRMKGFPIMKEMLRIPNLFHDPAISIVSDDENIVYAEGLERYVQNKRALNISPDHFVFIRELIKKYANDANEFVMAKTWESDMLDKVKQSIELLTEQQEGLCK